MPRQILSAEQVAAFQQDGYVIARSLFDSEETDILRKTAKADAAFKSHAHKL